MNGRLEVYQFDSKAFKIATSIRVLDADPCGTGKTNETPRLEECTKTAGTQSWTQRKQRVAKGQARAQRRLTIGFVVGGVARWHPLESLETSEGVWPVSVGAAQVSPFRQPASNNSPRAMIRRKTKAIERQVSSPICILRHNWVLPTSDQLTPRHSAPVDMRSALRLLANVKPARYLEPNTPIGLTGLTTHPSPRPTLIHVYRQTLEKLKTFPETSVYRKSTEALTRHRLQIIESTKPPGFDAWFERAKETVAKHPEHFKNLKFAPDGTYTIAVEAESANSGASFPPKTPEEVAKYEEEAAQFVKGELPENPVFFKKVAQTEYDPVLESEPALEAEQIAEIENKIGAGLIEEVVVVANDEFKLVDTLAESQVWEELEEKPSPGQWTYFERGPEKS